MLLETKDTAVVLNQNSITIVAKTYNMKVVLGFKEKTINYKDIYSLEYVKGNMFTDYRIIIGSKQENMTIFIPSTRKLAEYSQDFFLMLFSIVYPLGNLLEEEEEEVKQY